MDPVVTESTKFAALAPLFDEACAGAGAGGRGALDGPTTGMSRTTIDTGLKELAANEAAGARDDTPATTRRGPQAVRQALERLVDPVTRQMGPLLWTCTCGAPAIR